MNKLIKEGAIWHLIKEGLRNPVRTWKSTLNYRWANDTDDGNFESFNPHRNVAIWKSLDNDQPRCISKLIRELNEQRCRKDTVVKEPVIASETEKFVKERTKWVLQVSNSNYYEKFHK